MMIIFKLRTKAIVAKPMDKSSEPAEIKQTWLFDTDKQKITLYIHKIKEHEKLKQRTDLLKGPKEMFSSDVWIYVCMCVYYTKNTISPSE